MAKMEALTMEEKAPPVEAEESRLVSELEQMEAQYEPLLPVEKKLISWSVGLGIVALGLLVWISYTFFPGTH